MIRPFAVCILCVCICALPIWGAKRQSPVTFDFNDTDIKTVLKAFSAQSGLNIVPGAGVEGKISAHVKDMDPMEALQSVLSVNGFSMEKIGDAVKVVSNANMDMLPIKTFMLKHVTAVSVSELLTNSGVLFSVSPRLNAVSVQATYTKIKQIEKFLEEIDVPPLQVQIEAKIIELKSSLGESGNPNIRSLEFSYTDGNNNQISQQFQTPSFADMNTKPLGLFSQVFAKDMALYLSVLNRTVGYNVLASPRLITVNHEEAKIMIGRSYGYRTVTAQDGIQSENIQFMDVGTQLTLTPHIAPNGYIRMSIHPSISDGRIVDNLPVKSTTETTSHVFLKDQQTLIIGGLVSQSKSTVETGWPIISWIPLIGELFKRVEESQEKRDVMILIKPTILKPEHLAEMESYIQELEKQVGN